MADFSDADRHLRDLFTALGCRHDDIGAIAVSGGFVCDGWLSANAKSHDAGRAKEAGATGAENSFG